MQRGEAPYGKYTEDAEWENCPQCADLFRRLKAEDQRHVRQGTFHEHLLCGRTFIGGGALGP
ncbi:MAG: hypothetical protein C4289_01425 [Chloroflexota bacterium]